MRILLTADWHIRGDSPICRADEDWVKTQCIDIKNVHDIFVNEKCEMMWIMGDLFHRAVCSTETVNALLNALKLWERKQVRILPGNHDLPYHSYDNLENSSLGIVLKYYDELKCLPYSGSCHPYTAPFGLDDPKRDASKLEELDANVWVTHRLTFPNEEARPVKDCGYTAQELLDMAPTIPLVLTGDYHHGFIYTAPDGRRVVTPGCLNIQAVDMADYRPGVFVWDTCTGEITCHELPENGTITDQYMTAAKAKDERLEQCVAKIGDTSEITLDFEDNLEKALVGQKKGVLDVHQEIKTKLYGEKNEFNH